MRMIIAVAIAFMMTSSAVGEPLDLKSLKPKIIREPSYVTEQPLYGLVVVGQDASSRMWMVLDKGTAGSQGHDVLYVDLNGNGDLTEPNEKFARQESGRRSMFALPEIVDPATNERHTEFKLSISSRQPPTHMVSMYWRGQHKIGGGYPADPDDGYMRFAISPEQAPVLWVNGDGPFRFQRWYSDKFPIGGSDDLRLFLGQQGLGANSFCAFQRHVLPFGEPVTATLIYTNQDGHERQVKYQLKERC